MTDFYNNNNNTKPDPDLSFLPLSEGLGFHPFSDGLPYASTVKSARANPSAVAGSKEDVRPMGDGAVVAGVPKIILPTTNRSARQPPFSGSGKVLVPKPRPPDQVFGFGYMVQRIVAYTIDLFCVASLLVGSLLILVWKQNIDQAVFSNFNFILAFVGFVFFSLWILVGVQEVLFRTSLGKAWFGLRLDGTGLRIFTRSLLFLFGLGMLGLGLVWSLFDSRRRCWHDLASGLQPVKR